MIFSLLWWSTTFVVIFVIRPVNRTGNLSVVLPRIRKIILIASTISIVSGLILFWLLFDFGGHTLVITTKGILILTSGSLSLVVYYHILLGTRTRLSYSKSNMQKGIVLVKGMPYLMFGFLTITMISMVIVSSML